MQRTELAALYTATPADGTKVTVCGWAKTVRDSKQIGFISLTDGSCYKPVQIVFQADKLANYAEIAKCGLYTSFEVTGTLVLTPNAKQPFEINADAITVLGPCGPDYPLQKKKMGMDYLRTMQHLRPRTNTFNAAFRVRSQAAFAIHQFFHYLRAHADLHRFRLRGRGRDVPGHDAGPQRPAPHRGRRRRLQQGLF